MRLVKQAGETPSAANAILGCRRRHRAEDVSVLVLVLLVIHQCDRLPTSGSTSR
jgi:hypothetical protein